MRISGSFKGPYAVSSPAYFGERKAGAVLCKSRTVDSNTISHDNFGGIGFTCKEGDLKAELLATRL